MIGISKTALATALASILAGAVCVSEANDDDKARRWSSFRFVAENDFFADEQIAGNRSGDRFYTNGIRISLMGNPARSPAWSRGIRQSLEGLFYPDKKAGTAVGYSFGQYMYTPNDISIEERLADDRPYAGYLYGGILFVVGDTARRSQHSFEGQLGIVGPGAGGEWAQTEFHKLCCENKLPQGWDNQVPNLLGVSVIYLGRLRIAGPDPDKQSTHWDFVPHWGGAVGSVQTYLNGGFTIRAGRAITGFPPLTNAMTAEAVSGRARKRLEAYLFAGVDGRVMAHNAYLDTFAGDFGWEMERFVWDAKGGFSVRLWSFRLEFTYVSRSREFEPTPPAATRGGRHDFGSVSLGWDWKL